MTQRVTASSAKLYDLSSSSWARMIEEENRFSQLMKSLELPILKL